MATRCWLALTLVLLLAVGNSLADVDQNKLARLVKDTLNRFRPTYNKKGGMRYPMFSLAVSIPFNEKSGEYDLSLVPDEGGEVRDTMIKCKVYRSERVVGATLLRWPNVVDQCPDEPVQWPDALKKCNLEEGSTWAQLRQKCSKNPGNFEDDHAEFRVLQHLKNSLLAKPNHLLLFYVVASPCNKKCTNEQSPVKILESIKDIKKWGNYAFVFSDVFQPRKESKDEPEEALRLLGDSIGLENIYRCKKQTSMGSPGPSNQKGKMCQATPFIMTRR